MPRSSVGFCLLLTSVLVAAPTPPPLTGEAFHLAEETYRLQKSGDLPGALKSVEAALGASPDHPQLLRLKLDLLFASGSLPACEALRQRLAAQQPGDSALALFEVYLRQREGRTDEALALATRLCEASEIPAEVRRQARLARAYIHLSRQQDAAALEQFTAALGAQSPPSAWQDAAYAAKRLGRNTEAARLFACALDARGSLASSQADAAQEFGLRREVETLRRTWGVLAGTAYRQGGLFPGVVSEQRILQQGLEAYWQPEALAQNGRSVQFYVQAFENLHNGHEGTAGGPTVQGGAGFRIKPLASQNLVFAVQKLFQGGRLAIDDWLFRAAYSREAGLDLRPWQEDWNYWSFYTEGDSFAKTGHYVHQLELRAGHAWRVPVAGGSSMVSPHLVLAADYDNRLPMDCTAAGLGAGLSLRHWFREDRHQAPASWLDLTLQGRVRLNQASRGSGLFITLTAWF